jgi:hypothetical protein
MSVGSNVGKKPAIPLGRAGWGTSEQEKSEPMSKPLLCNCGHELAAHGKKHNRDGVLSYGCPARGCRCDNPERADQQQSLLLFWGALALGLIAWSYPQGWMLGLPLWGYAAYLFFTAKPQSYTAELPDDPPTRPRTPRRRQSPPKLQEPVQHDRLLAAFKKINEEIDAEWDGKTTVNTHAVLGGATVADATYTYRADIPGHGAPRWCRFESPDPGAASCVLLAGHEGSHRDQSDS